VKSLCFLSLYLYDCSDLFFWPGMEVGMEPGMEVDSMLLWFAHRLPFPAPRASAPGAQRPPYPSTLSPLYPCNSGPQVGSRNLYAKGRGFHFPYLFL